MANGEPMNSLSGAKAVLDTYGFEIHPTVKKALAAMIAENERLTAPLGEEGRALVRGLRDEDGPHGLMQASADLIERQAAQVVAKDAEFQHFQRLATEEYESVKSQLAALTAREVKLRREVVALVEASGEVFSETPLDTPLFGKSRDVWKASRRVLALIDREQEEGDAK